MFTNWLTGTNSSTATNSNNNRALVDNVDNNNIVIGNSGTHTPSIMATPPDVVLEVGPAPTVRFVAHSLVLGMHSGYLRSAIRLDENAALTVAGHAADLVLYLGNVTAEQFAPLLTYMYTGYLDLNVENIFGVLLATHVLHMPRALEICRSFLARAQTEGYLANALPSIPSVCSTSTAAAAAATPTTNGKVIRPIASKATLPNFGFLPANTNANTNASNATLAHHHHHQQQQQHQQQISQLPTPASVAAAAAMAALSNNSYKNLQQTYEQQQKQVDVPDEEKSRQSAEIIVDRCEMECSRSAQDEEDEEVFIDSNTELSDNEIEMDIDGGAISVSSHDNALCKRQERVGRKIEKLINRSRHRSSSDEREIVVTMELPHSQQPIKLELEKKVETTAAKKPAQPSQPKLPEKRERRKQTRRQHKSSSATGLQVAKAPIPASQLDCDERSKVIIDVASCDGPVRFRRILNTAYGHKPEDFVGGMPERTQQSVSLSFHQQMAKTISQQRQLQHAEESENSESSGGGGASGGAHSGSATGKQAGGKTQTNEIYVCVYCKHTFKSQYCYQKHAKRHLNPLSLSCASTSAAAAESCDKAAVKAATVGNYTRAHAMLPLPIVATANSSSGGSKAAATAAATELLRREVRPLDMNVQYYPCKTCGSKFPSYYFVHKHRKMCHADEEAQAEAGGSAVRNAASSAGGASSDSNAATSSNNKVD